MKKISLFIAFMCVYSSGAQAQIITTYAGDGYTTNPYPMLYLGRFAGDNGPATAGSLNISTERGTSEVAFDIDGNLFIADESNRAIRKVDNNGIITTIGGRGSSGADGIPATDAQLYPTGITVDASGNIYIINIPNVHRIDPSGIVHLFAGGGGFGYGGDGGSAIGSALSPYWGGLGVDHAGNLYIADDNNNIIRKVDVSTGNISTCAGTPDPYYYGGFSGDSGPATSAELSGPRSVAFDIYDNMYIADTYNGRIRKVSTSGVITTIAGGGSSTSPPYGDGGVATNAVFMPYAVACDVAGNIFITDASHSTIRKVNTVGVITTVAGTGVAGYSGDGGNATAAKLKGPSGLTLDPSGNLYIVDNANNRVRKVTFTSAVPAVICSGSSSTLTATAAGSGGTYTWAPAASLSATTGASVVASPTVTTIYTVTGTDVYGGITVNTVKVKIATITSGPASFCVGGSAVLVATGGSTYTWSPAIGLSATTGSTVTANPSASTVYTIMGVDANGCASSTTSSVTVNSLPTISGNSVSLCNGSSVAITATGGVTYTWSPSAGLSATTGGSPVASPTATTTYTVTGTDANGCVNTGTSNVAVNALPTISGNSVAICIGSSTVLAATGGVSYTWSPGTGLSATTGASPVASPTTTTIYTITGTNGNGCVNTATSIVTVNSLPTISGNSLTICSGSGATLTATGGVTYTWSPSTGLSVTTGASLFASPTATTTYTITGSNASGCVNTGTATIVINSLPTISGSSASLCNGSSAALTATGGVTYTWSPGTGLSATTGASTVASPTVTTTYTVIGTDAAGCVNTGTSTVTVNSLPTISGSSVSLCYGSSVTLSAAGGITYTWSPSTGLSATTGASPAANPISTTTYTVTGADANGCVNTGTATLVVNSLPIVGGSSVSLCNGSSAALTATGGVSYTWSPSTGLSATTGGSPVASPTVATIYTVTGTDANSCVNTGTSTVTVNSLPTISGNSSTICLGSSVTLAAIGGVSYTWSPGIGLSVTTGASPVASPATTTTYTVIGTDANGCVNTGTSTITVNSLPTISGTSLAICIGSGATLAGTGGVTYTWSPGAGLSATTGASSFASPTTTTIYTVTGTDANGCVNTGISTVAVNALPTISGNSVSLCNGSSVAITATGGVTYTWSPSIGLSVTTGASPVANPTTTTTYTVTGTDANGCINTGTATITVNLLPSVTAPANQIKCVGTSIAATTFTGTGTSYTWTNSDPSIGLAATGTGNISSFTALNATSAIHDAVVTVTPVTTATSCTGPSQTFTLTVVPPLTLGVSETSPIAVGGDKVYTYCTSDEHPFTLAVAATPALPATGVTYTWHPNTGSDFTTPSISPVLTASITAYTVTVVYGCTATIKDTVIIPQGGNCSPCQQFSVASSCSMDILPGLQPFHTVFSGTATGTASYTIVQANLPVTPTDGINNYYFPGNLSLYGTVAAPLDVSNKVILMNINKGISIPSGSKVDIHHSHIFSCGSWAGIAVSCGSATYGRLNLDQNSLIENAVNAISLSSGSATSLTATGINTTDDSAMISVNGCIFNNNTTCINLNYWPSAFPADSTLPFIISGNIFTARNFNCTSAVPATYTSTFTYPVSWPDAGFLTTRTDGTGFSYDPQYKLDYFTPTTTVTTVGPIANSGIALYGIKLAGYRTRTFDSTIGFETSEHDSYFSYRVGINNADGTRPPNMFDNLVKNGIWTIGLANLEMQNNIFRHIITYGDYVIKSPNGSNTAHVRLLMNNGLSSGYGNQFYVCQETGGNQSMRIANWYNISLLHTLMTLKDGYISATSGTSKTAIYIASDFYKGIYFNNNSIYNYHTGVLITVNKKSDNTAYNGDIFVNDNVFSAAFWNGSMTSIPDATTLSPTPWFTTPISILDGKSAPYTYSSPQGSIHIERNRMNQIRTGIAISSFSDMNATIDSNWVKIRSYMVSNGLKVANVAKVDVTNNTIMGEGYTVANVSAISLSGCGLSLTNRSDVRCNHVSNIQYGFNFGGTNFLNWRDNVILKNKYGLYLQGTIGQQGGPGNPIDNYWEDDGTYVPPTSYNYWWEHNANVYQTFVANGFTAVGSELYVRDNKPQNWPVNPTILPAGETWRNFSAGTGVKYSSATIFPMTISTSTLPFPSCTDQATNIYRGVTDVNQDMKNVSAENYQIFPNPNDGNMTITNESGTDRVVDVIIVNAVGVTVYQSKMELVGGKSTLQLNDVASGLYLVEILDSNGHRFTHRLVVQK